MRETSQVSLRSLPANAGGAHIQSQAGRPASARCRSHFCERGESAAWRYLPHFFSSYAVSIPMFFGK